MFDVQVKVELSKKAKQSDGTTDEHGRMAQTGPTAAAVVQLSTKAPLLFDKRKLPAITPSPEIMGL